MATTSKLFDRTDVDLSSEAMVFAPYTRPSSVPTSQKLSPLDLNMPRLYASRWILFFPLPASTDNSKVYHDLKLGLAHTVSSIPWVTANIGPEEGSKAEDDRIQLIEGSSGVRFVYKDLSTTLPSYTELKAANFPIAKLTTADLSPLGVMPQPPQPVMAAQANFITGGLLLTIAVHHAVCDASAVYTILDSWANNTSAVQGLANSTNYDPVSNDRTLLMNGDANANIEDFPEYFLQPTPVASKTAAADLHQKSPVPFELPPMSWKIFNFSPEALATLKHSANAYSTTDALNSFVWRHMTLARNPPNQHPGTPSDEEKTTALLCAVDIRSRTSPPLPPTYLGNASMAGITQRLRISDVTSASGLQKGAAAIRTALKKVFAPNRVPLTIGLLESRPNPADFKFACHAFLGPDVTTTSWSNIDVYGLTWGSYGSPEGFRLPGEGADGNFQIYPRLKDGGLEVSVALEDGAMGRLLADKGFGEFAKLWA